jgi:hypothetical protein
MGGYLNTYRFNIIRFKIKCTELDLIYLGDINLDLLNCSDNHHFLLTTLKYGLHNVIHEPTRITPTSSTLLDPIFVNERLLVIMGGYLNTYRFNIIRFKIKSPFGYHVVSYIYKNSTPMVSLSVFTKAFELRKLMILNRYVLR